MRKKKILASMLMAPMALSAFADINVQTPESIQGWTDVNGVSDQLQWKDNGVFCPVGVSSISTKLKLQPGKYKIQFGKLTNAQATITIGGKVIATLTSEALENEFTVEGTAIVDAENAVITINPIDTTLDFAYDNLTVILEFSFDAAKTALDAALAAAGTPIELLNGKADKTEYDAINAEITKIQGDIKTVGDEQTLKTYTGFKLWGFETAKDDISIAIAALKTRIESYNESATKANTKFTNEQNQAGLIGGADDLQAELDALKEKIEAVTDQKEYVEGKTTTPIADAQAAIDAYKAAVDAFYADNADKLETEVLTFEDKDGLKAAMDDAYAAAKTAFDTAQADVEAYNNFNKLVTDELYPAFQQAQTSLAGIGTKAIKGYNISPNIEAAQKEVQKLYDDNSTLALEGAYAAFTGAEKSLKDAIVSMKTITAELDATVDAQNVLMNEILTKIDAAQKTIDEQTEKKIDNQTVQDLIKAAQDAVDKLKGSAKTGYESLSLPTTDTNTDVAALDEAITNLTDAVKVFDDNTAIINNLQEKLDLEKTIINGGTVGETEYKGYEDEVKTRMQSTIANIQASINGLDINAPQLSVTDIENGITALHDTALKLNEAMKTVNAGIKAYNDYIAAIEKLAGKDGKLLLEGATATLGEEYKTFTEAAEAFKKAKTDALALEDDQACYNDLNKLANQWTDTDEAQAEKDATAIQQAYDQAGTESNISVVEKAKEALDEYVKGLELNDAAKATVTEAVGKFVTDIEAAKEALTAAEAAAYDHANYNAVDETLDKLNESIKGFKAQLEAYVSFNMTTLNDLLTGCNTLNNNYDEADDKGGANTPTLEPAHSYWDNLLNGADKESYKSQIADLQTNLDEALKAQDITDKQADLLKSYNSIKNGLIDVQTNIPANEKAHNTLLKESETLRGTINGYIADVDKRYEDVAGVPALTEKLDDYKAKLQALLDSHEQTEEEAYSNVAAVDGNVYKSYSTGNNGKEQGLYDQAYTAIGTAAAKIFKDFSDSFDNDITSANNSLLADTEWTDLIAELRAEYITDVRAYNLYMYGLTNPTYKDMVQYDLQQFAAIYDSNIEIDNRKAAFESYVEEQNIAHKAITVQGFIANAIQPAKDLLKVMRDRVTVMEAAVLQTAKNYYSTNQPNAFTAIENAKKELTNIGVTNEDIAANAIKAQQDAYDAAVADNDLYYKEGNFEQPADLAAYAYEMDKIANYLDKARKAVNYNAAANDQWTSEVNGANTTIAEYKGLTFDWASDSEKEAWNQALQTAEDAMAELPATSDSTTLLDNKQDLKDIMDALEAAKTAIDSANTNAKEAQEAYDKYTGDLANWQKEANNLRAFVESLAAGNDDMLTDVEKALKGYSDYIEANKNKLFEEDIQDEVANNAGKIETAINGGYASAITQENRTLFGWIEPLKAAFNDAKVNAPLSEEQAAGYQNDINEVNKRISLLPEYQPGMTAEEYANYQTNAIAIETLISDTYQALQSSWSKDSHNSANPLPDPAGNVSADITAAANAAQEALDAYNTLLAEAAEYSEFFAEGKYDEFSKLPAGFTSKLEAVKAAVAAEKNNIILTGNRYITDYNGIETNIKDETTALQTALDAAKNAKEFNEKLNTNYNSYLGQITDLESEFEALKEKIAGYGETIEAAVEGSYYGNIEYVINLERTNLNNAKEHNPESIVNETFSLRNLHWAKYYIDAAACEGAKLTINEPKQETEDVITTAANFLRNSNIVPEAQEALRQAISDARDGVENLENRTTEAGKHVVSPAVEQEYLDIADEYKQLKATLETAVNNAEANVFVPGDVCGAEGLTDGKVNSLDVQTLIDWLGQGLTYEDLVNEKGAVVACAADVMRNNVFNIGDVTKVIRLAMGLDESASPAGIRSSQPGAGLMNVEVISSENGLTTYAVNINSQLQFVGGQLDLIIPDGCSIVSAQLESDAHTLYQYDSEDGVRFIIASMENADLVLDGDRVLTITVKGDGKVAAKGATFADAHCFTHDFITGEQSGIDDVNANRDGSMIERIYDISGRTVRALQRGINIIRHADGSVTKEYHK